MNKIGLHIIGGWRGNLGRPRLVKLVDVSVEYVKEVRQAIGPQALIIIRWVQGSQPLDNPVARAQQFVARYQSQMLAMAQVAGPNIAFEGYNEIPDSQAAAYAQFEMERLRLMHNLGLRSVIGNFSVGTPDLPVWKTYLPMVRAMKETDFLGLHEYWVDTADIDNEWHCGRYALVPELYGFPLQIVITECGRDIVEGRGQPGWRRTCDAQTFLNDLQRYNDRVLERQGVVVGATVFTTPGPGGSWADFDPSPVWPEVIARYSNPQTYPYVVVPVSPVPKEPKGPDPNVPYWHSSRQGVTPRYIILHDTEGSAQAALSWWQSEDNPYRSSAHYLIKTDGTVVPVVPEHLAAHHVGGSYIPGYNQLNPKTGQYEPNANLVTIGIELEYPASPASPPWPEVQVAAAAKLVADVAQRHGIARDHILRHADIDPKNRTDPRNLDWAAFIARIREQEVINVEGSLREEAWRIVGVPQNPAAAFYKVARDRNLGAPLGTEHDIRVGQAVYRVQPFAGGIVYAEVGKWDDIRVLSWFSK